MNEGTTVLEHLL